MALTIRVSGTLWNLRDRGLNDSYPWTAAIVRPVTWLRLGNSLGTIEAPSIHQVGTSSQVFVRVSAANTSAGVHDSILNVWVELPTLADITRSA